MSTMNELMAAFNTQSTRNQELQRQLDSFCRVHKYDPYGCCMCCVHACDASSVPQGDGFCLQDSESFVCQAGGIL